MKTSEIKFIEKSFRSEGLDPKNCDHLKDATKVFKDGKVFTGFYTYRIEKGVPFLQHFFVAKEFRGAFMARKLIKDFKNSVKKSGYKSFIVHAPVSNVGIQKLLCHYFRKPFYARQNGNRFMHVEV